MTVLKSRIRNHIPGKYVIHATWNLNAAVGVVALVRVALVRVVVIVRVVILHVQGMERGHFASEQRANEQSANQQTILYALLMWRSDADLTCSVASHLFRICLLHSERRCVRYAQNQKLWLHCDFRALVLTAVVRPLIWQQECRWEGGRWFSTLAGLLVPD